MWGEIVVGLENKSLFHCFPKNANLSRNIQVLGDVVRAGKWLGGWVGGLRGVGILVSCPLDIPQNPDVPRQVCIFWETAEHFRVEPQFPPKMKKLESW